MPNMLKLKRRQYLCLWLLTSATLTPITELTAVPDFRTVKLGIGAALVCYGATQFLLQTCKFPGILNDKFGSRKTLLALLTTPDIQAYKSTKYQQFSEFSANQIVAGHIVLGAFYLGMIFCGLQLRE